MAEAAKLRVVVAEDEPFILNSITRKIEAANGNFHVVDTAQDGRSALQSVEKNCPDILFTDIHMPVMDGLTLIDRVVSRYPNLMIVIISGYNDFSYAQAAIKYGVRDYLLKPIKKDQLGDTLTRLRIAAEAQNKALQGSGENGLGASLSSREAVRLVETYIRENYRNDINLDQIAQKFNFNASYLSKSFTRYIGENPSKYLISLRINEAKRLLINDSSLSVKEVGERVGYADQYHFSHIFKLISGKSPSAFREAYLPAREAPPTARAV